MNCAIDIGRHIQYLFFKCSCPKIYEEVRYQFLIGSSVTCVYKFDRGVFENIEKGSFFVCAACADDVPNGGRILPQNHKERHDSISMIHYISGELK